MIKREALERAGGFPEDIWPGEDTVLTAPFADNRRLAFVPTAQVTHLNRIAAATDHQVEQGAQVGFGDQNCVGPK